MKYVLDMLPETEILKCKLVDAPMDPNSKVMPDQVAWSKRHRRLVRKLNHLTITQPDITCKLVYVGYSKLLSGMLSGFYDIWRMLQTEVIFWLWVLSDRWFFKC